jgi:hypothetical protein
LLFTLETFSEMNCRTPTSTFYLQSHDWADPEALAILRAVRRAAPPRPKFCCWKQSFRKVDPANQFLGSVFHVVYHLFLETEYCCGIELWPILFAKFRMSIEYLRRNILFRQARHPLGHQNFLREKT